MILERECQVQRVLYLQSRRLAHERVSNVRIPARSTPIIGSDGKSHVVDDGAFVNRLWQFIAESLINEDSKQLVLTDLDSLGQRIEHLKGLASKGVHADVSEFEVNVCIMGTYSAIGMMLRLIDQNSAALTMGKRF